jgi:phospho-N-acetylmuramoyl-pentapeptide-transferase
MKGILISGALAAFLSIFSTPFLIRFLTRKGYGQFIRDDGPTTHHVKHGTPTMGGIVFIASSIISYFISHLVTGIAISASAVLILGLMLALGLVGLVDDWLKVSRQRSLGLNETEIGWSNFSSGNICNSWNSF